ncbi:DUF5906 domain-containing protein [Maricaulis sp.]|uniref:DUF5906 domain-containing protein n=1 Tax=Maricaulis sp. TaxID=1486257 RepID=UPI003A936444
MSEPLAIFQFVQQFAALAREDRFAAFDMTKGKGYRAQNAPVTDLALQAHLSGTQPIAVYPLREDQVQVAAFDIDDKGGTSGWEAVQAVANALCTELRGLDLKPFSVRSGGGYGVHIFLLWPEPQLARDVRAILARVLKACGHQEGTGGVGAKTVEIYPKQDSVPAGKLGNAIALPFSRLSRPLLRDLTPVEIEAWQVPELVDLFSPDLPPQPASEDGPKPKSGPRPAEHEVPMDDDLERTREALKCVSSENYGQWITVGLALKRSFGKAGRDVWLEWSARSEDKFPGEATIFKEWAGLKPDGRVGLGTIFHLAREGGWNGPGNEDLRAMNARFGILTHGSKVLIIVKNGDRRPEDEFITLSKDSFITRLKPERVPYTSPDGTEGRREVARWWLDHRAAAHYHRLDFDPNLPPGHNGKTWNLWSGFSEIPAPGTWDRLRAHIEEVICDGNADTAAWVLNWMALGLQEPGYVIGTAPVLLGSPGTGKGFFVHQYGALWGQHFSVVTHPEHVTGRFNSHLFAKRVLFIDEGTFGGSKRDAGVIKTRITEDWIMIEQKGVDPIRLRNRLITLVASNEDSAVTADLQDRRWQVLDVSSKRREDHGYFRKIAQEMNAGGRAAMMYDLLRRDLRAGPDPRKTIKTAALFGQVLEASATEFRYLHQLLDTGVMPAGKSRGDGQCETTISDLWEDFRTAFPSANYTSKPNFGRKIQKWMPDIKTEQSGTFYDGANGPKRSTRYIWPPLGAARAKFERVVGQEVEWAEPDAQWSCLDVPI